MGNYTITTTKKQYKSQINYTEFTNNYTVITQTFQSSAQHQSVSISIKQLCTTINQGRYIWWNVSFITILTAHFSTNHSMWFRRLLIKQQRESGLWKKTLKLQPVATLWYVSCRKSLLLNVWLTQTRLRIMTALLELQCGWRDVPVRSGTTAVSTVMPQVNESCLD